MLTLPYLQQTFEIETDASDYVIGIVLTRQVHPMAYHNETLSDTVQKYPTYEKEMYSIVQVVVNESITLWGRKQSSTQTTNLCSSYRHKGSCRMIAIRNGRHTYNDSIWTLSTRMGTPIMLQTASFNHHSWHWSLCSTPMGTRIRGGCIFTRVIQNSAAHTRHS